jgi:hypothetical protein
LVTLSVSNAEVRACDLLLDGVGNESLVTFGSQVRGEVVRRPPRAGVSLVALGDAAISEAALSIEDPAAAVTLASAICFDSAGAPVADAGLVLQ